jgi:hypothetical protein
MEEHRKFLAQHILTELNKMGIVKDAQVNGTSIRFVADCIQSYMHSQTLKFETAKEA